MDKDDLTDVTLNEEFDFFGETLEAESFDDLGFVSDKDKEEKEEKKEKEEPEEIDTTFDLDTPKEEEKKEEESVEEADDVFSAIKTIFGNGYFELEEGEELTEENADEIFREKFQSAVNEEVSNVFEGFDDDMKDLIKFAAKGGNVKDYLQHMTGDITPDMDITKEDNQVKFLKNKFKNDGYTDEEIQLELDRLKENGKIEDISQIHFKKWKKKIEEEKKKKLAEVEKTEMLRKENMKKTKNEFSEFLKTNKFKDIKISEKDKKDLPDYIMEPKYRLDNGAVISEYQKDLYEITKNKEKTVILAKILQSGVDLSKIKSLVETELTDKFKKKVQRNKLLESKKNPDIGKEYNPLQYFD